MPVLYYETILTPKTTVVKRRDLPRAERKLAESSNNSKGEEQKLKGEIHTNLTIIVVFRYISHLIHHTHINLIVTTLLFKTAQMYVILLSLT